MIEYDDERHGWTHPICVKCWDELTGGAQPVRLVEPEDERCCRCGQATDSGIYYRHDWRDPSWVCPDRGAESRRRPRNKPLD